MHDQGQLFETEPSITLGKPRPESRWTDNTYYPLIKDHKTTKVGIVATSNSNWRWQTQTADAGGGAWDNPQSAINAATHYLNQTSS